MYERNAIAALAILAAWLSVAALARTGRPNAQATPPPPHRAEPQLHGSALRALRDGERIDLNRAAIGDLELLPGIGPALAQRIVDERMRHGSFSSVDDLRRVHGIGARTIERLGASLRVETRSSAVEDEGEVERRRQQEPRVGTATQQQQRPHVDAERPLP
jgi:competence ComEA-like helix-hairpin-helix protein